MDFNQASSCVCFARRHSQLPGGVATISSLNTKLAQNSRVINAAKCSTTSTIWGCTDGFTVLSGILCATCVGRASSWRMYCRITSTTCTPQRRRRRRHGSLSAHSVLKVRCIMDQLFNNRFLGKIQSSYERRKTLGGT